MSLVSSNSHCNGAGNLIMAHCSCIEMVLEDSWMTATVSCTTVCSVGCDELSSDAARAHRWHPAGQPGLFVVVYVIKRPVNFRAPARQIK